LQEKRKKQIVNPKNGRRRPGTGRFRFTDPPERDILLVERRGGPLREIRSCRIARRPETGKKTVL
jgi:hypothetical protein